MADIFGNVINASIGEVGKIIGIFFAAIVVLFIVGYIIIKKRSGKGYEFLFYSKNDYSRPLIIKAFLTNMKDDRSQKEFILPQFNQRLSIKNPTLYVGKKAYREIHLNDRGEFDYLGVAEIVDRKKVKPLLPEEKQILVNRYRMNAERYQSGDSKYQMLTVLGQAFLALLIVAGMGYTAYKVGDMAKVQAQNSEDIKAAADTIAHTGTVMGEVSERLLQVSANLVSSKDNFTRAIS